MLNARPNAKKCSSALNSVDRLVFMIGKKKKKKRQEGSNGIVAIGEIRGELAD